MYKFLIFFSIFIFLPEFVLVYSKTSIVFSLIFVVMMYMFSRTSKVVFTLLSFIVVLINSIYIHIYMHWGIQAYKARLQVATFSPLYEKIEYLQTFLNAKDIWIGLYFIFYIIMIIFYLKKISIDTQFYKHKLFILVNISFLILIEFVRNPFTTNVPPFNFIYTYIDAGGIIAKTKERDAFIKDETDSFLKRTSQKDKLYKNIIIVIGESASRNHMSCFGYKRETTPFFDTLKESNISTNIFAKAISPGNRTSLALPLELTDANVGSFNDFFHTFSLVSFFKQNGYFTYWISNQGKVGKFDNYITSMAKEADKSYFYNLDFSSAGLDMKVVDKFKKLYNSKQNKYNVFFIHIMGSHFDYKKRYDKEHSLIKNTKTFIDTYDNSIYYTDKVLEQLYDIVKKDDSLFVYFSDHAELVTKTRHVHGMLQPNKDVYEVPLVILSSMPNQLLEDINTSFINLDSLNNIVLFISGLKEKLESKLVNSDLVSAVNPGYIYHFNDLNKSNGE